MTWSNDDLSKSVGVESTETAFADHLLRIHRDILDELIRDKIDLEKRGPNWKAYLRVAESELDLWQAQSRGRKQNYSPEELAEAQIARAVANAYEEREYSSLQRMNGEHQAQVAVNIRRSGLAERMIEEGKQGRKLSVLEISSRLAPVLTFPGSSNYFEMAALPYGTHARAVLGEAGLPHYVSSTAAEGSARNMQERFGTHYVLAETSAAPRGDVPKSKRAPEVFVCSLIGSEIQQLNVQFPDVQLRAEFDARVREVLYQQLQRMYAVK
ncbi:hypothetical protein HZC31_03075 [Candidatus Woesearchaeota archaeon]|nr:hypothetical protein [Candidatus Woesearchaeota archaeon]